MMAATVRRNIRFENALQAFQRIRGGHAMRRIGVNAVIHRARERPEADFVGRDLTGEGHGHKGTAVETAAEGNQPRTTGVSAGDFHRVSTASAPVVKKAVFAGPSIGARSLIRSASET